MNVEERREIFGTVDYKLAQNLRSIVLKYFKI